MKQAQQKTAVLSWLKQRWPLHYQASWDNSGLLLGEAEKPINSVLIALDATTAVVEEAVEAGVDLLLTHHPIIFSGLKSLTDERPDTAKLLRLAQRGIASYAMHTNFDCVDMGRICAAPLHLQNSRVLEEIGTEEDGRAYGYGLIGELIEKKTVAEVGMLLRTAFGLDQLRLFGEADRQVSRIAILPGSGRHSVEAAVQKGAELFISGDIGHHEGLDACEEQMAVLDAGHYGLEQCFIRYVAEELRQAFPQLRVIETRSRAPLRLV
ncbi:MAG: Nif3-like dinuclear metal center hexameric protein [Eubacteriales bacterium]|nr:Nif3-like dinuclear metal center hexameric protein [Eubacteriales bacterium]